MRAGAGNVTRIATVAESCGRSRLALRFAVLSVVAIFIQVRVVIPSFELLGRSAAQIAICRRCRSLRGVGPTGEGPTPSCKAATRTS